jgi:threonine dehydrogenase-like Zn-dependent dehydrogenase
MKFKKISLLLCVAMFLALAGCATVTQDQAVRTVKSKYPNALFIYVDAPNDAISSGLMAAHLKVASSTTSDVMVKMLLLSHKMPGVVAGKSDVVTAATIRRAIDDAGAALPKNGQLVIVGEPKDFEDTVSFAKSRGLNVDVMSPVQRDGSPSIVNEPLTVAPPKEQSIKLQEEVQKVSNNQMNQFLQGGGRK